MIPTITAIIPTYNRANYICEAIDSVLAQSHPLDEIIVIDDGSTDNTRELLDSYGNRIEYFSQCNRGPGAARNYGMRVAKGDFLAFLDSDDVWVPDKTRIQLQMFNNFPDLDIVFGDMANFSQDRDNNVPEIKNRQIHDYCAAHSSHIEHILDCLVIDNIIPTPTVIIRKSCISKIGFFDDRFTIAEDFDYWLRAARCCRFGFTNAVLIKRRRHGNNLVNNWPNRMISRIEVLERFRKDYHDLSPQTLYLLARQLDKTRYDLGSHFFRKGDYVCAWEHLKKCSHAKIFNMKWCLKVVISLLLRDLFKREHQVH